MPKAEWGKKRVCPTTGRRFYDLGRTPIVSPYTGDVVSFDIVKSRRSLVADRAEERRKEAAEFEEDDIVLEDDTDVDLGDDVLEDDDEDDVSLDDIADVGGGED